MDSIKAFVSGKKKSLEITGDAPSQVRINLRRLEELGLLSNEMLWSMLAQTQVDPLFLVKILRSCKDKAGLNQEEHQFIDCVVFTAGEEKKSHLFATTLHVNVFTNDVQRLTLRDDKYEITGVKTAEQLFDTLKGIEVGEERLELLLETVKEFVNEKV